MKKIFSNIFSTNIFAWIFDKIREVVEAAETPMQKLAIIFLPIAAPIIPGGFTGFHIFKMMIDLFDFGEYTFSVAVVTAAIVGVVLELLGYVGAMLLVYSVYQLIRSREASYILPSIINLTAYFFYLFLIWKINHDLGLYFGSPKIMNDVISALSLLTVATGLISANYLSQKSLDEKDAILRGEKMDFSLRKTALKYGHNIFETQQTPQPQGGTLRGEKPASHYHDKIIDMLNAEFSKSGKVLELTQITERLKINHTRNKGYISNLRKEWKSGRGL